MPAPMSIPKKIDTITAPGFSSEIQGLRGIAIISVILFHLWPSFIPGGYIGVDVFFVISGYLITTHLMKSQSSSKRAFLIDFYIRRVNRLLPASLTVLFITLLISFFILPSTRWEMNIKETIASIFYAENWLLISTKLDYLNADSFLSPIQHFWSLSIEEQFYLFWPLLFIFFSPVKIKNSTRAAIFTLVILSFFYSIYITHLDPQISYLSSFSRFWELGIGGLCAVFLTTTKLNSFIRSTLIFFGLVGIFAALFLFDHETKFPGPMAILPVLSTALIIVGIRTASDPSPKSFISYSPLVHIGDISYSLYLWHWPLIIFSSEIFEKFTSIHKLFIIFVSYCAAFITKKFIEDRFRARDNNACNFYRFKSFIYISMTFASICTLSMLFINTEHSAEYTTPVSDKQYPGAEIFRSNHIDEKTLSVDFLPSVNNAKNDISPVYKDGCHANENDIAAKVCIYGNSRSTISLAIIGDSHAAQWVPALIEIAEKRGWKLISITKSSCAFTGKTIYLRDRRYGECDKWYSSVLDKIKEFKPTVVIATNYVGHLAYGAHTPQESDLILSEGLINTWKFLVDNNIDVVVIKDSPKIGIEVPDCIAKNIDAQEKCFVIRNSAFSRSDPLVMAAQKSEKIKFVDLSDKICRQEICRPIEGNVLVYRDGNHLTATYVKTLSYFIDNELRKLSSLR